MKHLVVSLLIVAACGKANDLPAMKAEAEAIVKSYRARFEELQQRAQSILQRGHSITVADPEAMHASRTFAQANTRIKQCDQNNPTVCTGGILVELERESAELAKFKDKLELQKHVDKLSKKLLDAYTEINADLDAVESWLTFAEARPQVAKREEPVVPPPPSPELPPAGGAGGAVPPPQ